MKLSITIALVLAALTLGVAGAAAAPDGSQPQLREGTPSEAFDRHPLDIDPAPSPDAFARYVKANSTALPDAGSAASHPDSQAVRPGVIPEGPAVADGGIGFSWESGVIGAFGAALIGLALLASLALRDGRRPVLR